MNKQDYQDLINDLDDERRLKLFKNEKQKWKHEANEYYNELSTYIRDKDIGRGLGELEVIKKLLTHIENFWLMLNDSYTNIPEAHVIGELSKYRKNISDEKREDYTKKSKDVLANFKNVADKVGLNKYQVWGVYFQKHFDALITYVKSNGQSESEPIKDRISDALNYLELLYAMVVEDHNKSKLNKQKLEKIVESLNDKTSKCKLKGGTPKNPLGDRIDHPNSPTITCQSKNCCDDGSCRKSTGRSIGI